MQETKTNLKEKIVVPSLIIGIISVIGSWIWIFFPRPWIDYLMGTERAISYYLFLIFISLIGLFLGILGLKSKRRIIAIIGTILCLIGVLLLVIFLLIEIGFIKTTA